MAINAYQPPKNEGLTNLLATVKVLSDMGILPGDTANKKPLYEQQTQEAKYKNTETAQAIDPNSAYSKYVQGQTSLNNSQNASVDPASAAAEEKMNALGALISAKQLQENRDKNPVSKFIGEKMDALGKSTDSKKLLEALTIEQKRAEIEKAKNPPLNEAQSKDAGFYERMDQAERSLSELFSEGFDPTTAGNAVAGSKIMPEIAKPEGVKLYDQNKSNFISAVLRKESGAAIAPSEYDREDKKYFPQQGDTPRVIEQKAESRRIATDSMKRSAGAGYRAPPAQPKFDQDVLDYAKAHKITPQAAQAIKIQRTSK